MIDLRGQCKSQIQWQIDFFREVRTNWPSVCETSLCVLNYIKTVKHFATGTTHTHTDTIRKLLLIYNHTENILKSHNVVRQQNIILNIFYALNSHLQIKSCPTFWFLTCLNFRYCLLNKTPQCHTKQLCMQRAQLALCTIYSCSVKRSSSDH